MEDNNLKDRMDNTWQTPFYLINKCFLTAIIPLFHYSNSRLKSGLKKTTVFALI